MTDAVAANAEVEAPKVQLEIEGKPAAPVAETPKPPEVKIDETPVITYEPTGDPGLDVALDFMGRQGIAQDHPAMVAAINGDFAPLKAHLAAQGDKARGWEHHVALGERAYQEAAQQEQQTATAITTAVHSTVGGEAQWTAIQSWARATADPDEKTQINAMLTAGPVQARAAALMLQDLYNKAQGVTRNPAEVTRGSSSRGAPAANTTPLNRREAVALVNDLVRKHGSHQIEQRPEYRAIWSRVPGALK